MKVKQAMRYYFSDYTLTLSVFYLVIVLLYAVALVAALAFPSVALSINGMDFSMIIFIFVLGLNSFRPQFRFFLQNGVSRRTQLTAFHLSALCIAAGMTVIDLLFPMLFGRVLNTTPMVTWMFGFSNVHPLSLLWSVLLYLTMAEIGFLVTTLFYRMSKALKLLVSIGVPVLLFVVLPLVVSLLPGLGLGQVLANLVGWFLGQVPLSSSPTIVLLRANGNLLLTAAVCALCSWLLVRKAILKND